jgi:tellurite resistance protein TerC
MTVSLSAWVITLVALIAIIVIDLIIVDRRPPDFTAREATKWISVYVFLSMVFAVIVWVQYGASYAGQFVAGYIT